MKTTKMRIIIPWRTFSMKRKQNVTLKVRVRVRVKLRA
jgi:hypothetical protein